LIKKFLIIGTISTSLILGACSQGEKSEDEFLTDFDGKVEHVHGLGYMGGDDIAIASHHGLKIYKDKKWLSTTEQNHDYMGFNAVDEGFYTSGHPEKGSKLSNPLGIQKSTDKGKTLTHVAFEGDFDFHTMGVGYQNHVIYVFNGHGNSQLSTGLHKTVDEGDSWKSVKGEGLQGEVVALAVHPTDDKQVAAATKNGIYYSNDGGESFSAIEQDTNGTVVYFTEDKLWYGAFQTKPILISYDLDEEVKENISLPQLGQDAVAYFAKKADSDEMVFYTYQNHSYISQNKGDEWKQIVKSGQIK